MKKILSLVLCSFVLLGCSEDKEVEKEVDTTKQKETTQSSVPELDALMQFQDSYAEDTPVAIMHTDQGDIAIVLFPSEAPKACENFMTHAKEGYYDGLTFHRVINEFMIQSGDPQGNGTGGESIWGTPFEDEFSANLFHFRGALSMANAGSNTNGSQFFIVQASSLVQELIGYPTLAASKYEEVGGTPWLDGQHTIFGQVIDGMDVVDAIAALENSDTVAIIQSITMTTYQEYQA